MKKISLVVTLFFLISNVCGQNSFGIEIKIGKSKFVGISTDTIVAYGYSGAKYSQNNDTHIYPSIRFRKSFSNKFFGETGLAYEPIFKNIKLDFYNSFFRKKIDTTLIINLHYLTIPVGFGYSFPISKKSSIVTSLELNTAILLYKTDNYEDIILEEIGWIKRDWYSKVILSPLVSISYQVRPGKIGMIELGIYASENFNSFVKKSAVWGFYHNLSSAKNILWGIQLKYFF